MTEQFINCLTRKIQSDSLRSPLILDVILKKEHEDENKDYWDSGNIYGNFN